MNGKSDHSDTSMTTNTNFKYKFLDFVMRIVCAYLRVCIKVCNNVCYFFCCCYSNPGFHVPEGS